MLEACENVFAEPTVFKILASTCTFVFIAQINNYMVSSKVLCLALGLVCNLVSSGTIKLSLNMNLGCSNFPIGTKGTKVSLGSQFSKLGRPRDGHLFCAVLSAGNYIKAFYHKILYYAIR